MNLTELLNRQRRSEPTILLGLKIFTMIMLITCLTGYLTVVIIDVKQDAPIIKTSFIDVDGVPPPSLHFGASYNFSITTCNQYYYVNGVFSYLNCSPDDINAYYDQETKLYYVTYYPSPDVIFNSSLNGVGLIMSVNEEIQVGKTSFINLIAFDSEYDIFNKKLNEFTVYDSSIRTLNRYSIEPAQSYDFAYSRIVRDIMVPSWMNDFGVPPNYDQKSNIESTLLGGPLPDKSMTEILSFSIEPKSYSVIQVDKEVRSKTYLSGLGLMGGAWGLTVAVYTFLFGADTLRPWGAVQLYCCGFSRLTRKKLKTTLPTIPFFDTMDLNTKNHPSRHALSLAEQNELILARIDSLELFLQEYVVDVRYLDGLRDGLPTTNIMNNLNNHGVQNLKEFDSTSTTNSTVSTVTQQQDFVSANFTQNSTYNNFTTIKYD
ncbi:hypothetical protein RhiirA5_412867 [Rhizophagus irregularis]|uniref:Uncharacterized protein n=3 Tax=Rhizophagus irregularis TaxID=588596 RepID=A0A2N0PXP1_9GLOM|nr:hypothetical protein RirG_170590 [Rhizophagus irregularis DAOM 197198w]PKC11601.1 hypothetical protein RhiirA5_412867 [Rhizophagus irregularis]GBC30262.2 galactose oxidase [Rhizophagus irregularis DAOM 181602=DAOM 197198]PKC67634.1 hypothetical protein RhiirA1_458180 [Rhizophagus irregularis]UZO18955.1 hypothetical protein OCT59_010262 [Rhizophagus irregularis]